MATLEEGQEILVFHPDNWLEPFRAIVIRSENDDRLFVRSLDPVVGIDGETLFAEGEYLVVQVEHVVEDDNTEWRKSSRG